MRCASGNKMKTMCTNPSCPEMLDCCEDDCISCFSKHQHCNAPGIRLAITSNKLKDMDELKTKCLD
jgi:hypothetical protein